MRQSQEFGDPRQTARRISLRGLSEALHPNLESSRSVLQALISGAGFSGFGRRSSRFRPCGFRFGARRPEIGLRSFLFGVGIQWIPVLNLLDSGQNRWIRRQNSRILEPNPVDSEFFPVDSKSESSGFRSRIESFWPGSGGLEVESSGLSFGMAGFGSGIQWIPEWNGGV